MLKVYLNSALLLVTTKALRYGMVLTRDCTVLPATKHELYLALLKNHHKASLPLAGAHCAYLHRDGQAELTYRWMLTSSDKFPH